MNLVETQSFNSMMKSKTPIPNSGYCHLMSRTSLWLESPLITIQVHMTPGLPKFKLVGMPQLDVRESIERVRSAIISSGFVYPNRRFTVNLSPAEIKKKGNQFDLAIAVGILVASNQIIPIDLFEIEFFAGLALDGNLESVASDLIGAAIENVANKRKMVICSFDAAKVNMINGLMAYGVKNLQDVKTWLEIPSQARADMMQIECSSPNADTKTINTDKFKLNIRDIIALDFAKRAALICLSGGHNLLLIGSPGTGKTMLAEMMHQFLPPLSEQESLLLRMINIRNHQPTLEWLQAPFRNPHHSASAVAMSGGGSNLKAGEITFAHRGILFMDEFPEYDRRVLEALREPMQNGKISISRINGNSTLPADFILLAAMNPCPCGYYGETEQICSCTADQRQKYRNKISGPLLDRIDLHVQIRRKDSYHTSENPENKKKLEHDNAYFFELIKHTRKVRQLLNVHKINVATNYLQTFLASDTMPLIEKASDYYSLSRRQLQKLLNLSLTIAILNQLSKAEMQISSLADNLQKISVQSSDISEGLGYLPQPKTSTHQIA